MVISQVLVTIAQCAYLGNGTMSRYSPILSVLLALLVAACDSQSHPTPITATHQGTAIPIMVTRMAGLVEGQLLYETGCLRVQAGGYQGVLLVWPAEYAAIIKDDTVQVTTGQLGGDQDVVTLKIGSWVKLGRGSVPVDKIESYLQQQVPPQCHEPYVWVVGTIYSATPTPPP